MSLADELAVIEEEPLVPESKLLQARRERDAAKRQGGRLQIERDAAVNSLETLLNFTESEVEIPSWVAPKSSAKVKRGIATLLVSDTHFDEVVDPDEIEGLNAYNRDIASLRLKATFEKSILMTRDYVTGVRCDGAVVMLGGDMVTGVIHEELAQSNDAFMTETVLYWTEQICAGIQMMKEEYKRVHVAGVVGNHGRMTRKPRAKGRAKDNWDWLIYKIIEREFRNDKNVTFQITEGTDVVVPICDYKFRLTHGDQFSGGGGIGGLAGPLANGNAKKLRLAMATDNPYDYLCVGHFHTYMYYQNMIANGCFPFGSKVMTATGYTEIQDVQLGDTVMSNDGTEQKVTHLWTHDPDRLVGLKVMGLPEVLKATPNHQIRAVKRNSGVANVPPPRRDLIGRSHGDPQWIPIDHLSPGDYVHVPFPKGYEQPVDSETAWAYGLYLAEGNAVLEGGAKNSIHRIDVTMHIEEASILERWAAWFEKTYGKVCKITLRENKTTSNLSVCPGKETVQWFHDTFGHKSIGKHLPDGALYWSNELKAALLEGWIEGDGHVAAQDDCRPTVSATTISPRMAWEMFYLSPSAGTWPSLSKVKAGGPRINDSYSVHQNIGQHVIVIDGEAYYEIGERFEFENDEPVYDLEVSGEHTYVVGGVGVHNSTKGYDEYAYQHSFNFEKPQQAFWITTPEYGVTFPINLQVENREAEGW